MAEPSTSQRAGAFTVVVTAVLDGPGLDLVVELADGPDVEPALHAFEDLLGTSDLVVERTGRALPEALAGRELVSGDRLVRPGRRRRPALHGVTGPLRGASVTVAAEQRIGRGAGAGGRPVDDPALSREHLVVTAGPDGLRGRDLGSSNGTRRNGEPLTGEVPLDAGDVLELGSSTVVVLDDPDRGDHLRVGGGVVGLNPSAAFPEVAPVVRVGLAPPPTPPAGRPFRWLALVGGIAAGVVMAVLFQAPHWLILSVAGPVIGGLQWVTDRRRDRRSAATADAAWFERSQAEVDAAWASGRDLVAWNRARWPDPATVVAGVAAWSGRLWERQDGHPAFLTVRVGSATVELPVAGRPSALDPERYPPEVVTALREALTHPHQPITVDLRAHRVVGVAGAPGAAGEHLAAWLAHLAATHSPTDLQLGVVAAPGSTALRAVAGGVRWTPHLGARLPGDIEGTWWRQDPGAGVALEEHLADRRERSDGDGGRWTVLVVEVAAVAPAQIRRIDELAADVSVTVVWVAPSFAQLPRECSTTVELDASGTAVVRRRTADGSGATSSVVAPDRLDADLFESTCRALAPLQDEAGTGGAGVLPEVVSLAALHDAADLTSDVIADRWSRLRDISLRLPVAEGREGPVVLPFPGEVPHGYVVGTTGSGKSVFLQGLVASAAATAPPSAVNFFFIDFRDGAAFRPFEHLPHTVGFLTSLDRDPGLAERAQASLTRELARRGEIVSSGLGLSKIEEVWEHHPEQAFPRLLIVVDEVQALREAVPDFMDELFDIASRGRGAGVNLLLATQLPRNLPEPIRQLCGLRVALRTENANDSREAVGIAGAERIDPSEQGRALIAVGSRPAVECRIATPAPARAARPTSVRVLGGPTAGDAPGRQEALNQVISGTFVPAVRRAWTGPDPRPLVVPPLARELDAPDGALGSADRPAEQWQGPAAFDLATDRGAIVLGPVGSGVTATLRQLAATVLDDRGGRSASVLVATGDPSRWADLADHPRSVGVLDHGDLGEVHHLLGRLEALCDERAVAPDAAREPIVLVLDDAHVAVPAGEGSSGGLATLALGDRLVALAERGPGHDVHVVAGFARTSRLVKRLLPLAGLHLLLPGGDVDSEVARQVFGADERVIRQHRRRRDLPPGRGFDRHGTEVQVGAPAQADARIAAAARRARAATPPLPRLSRLPDALELDAFAEREPAGDPRLRPPLAVDHTGRAVGPSVARPFLLAGDAGSGRSNALSILLASVARHDPGRRLLLVSARPTTVGQLEVPIEPLDDPATAADLLDAALDDGRPLVVAVEGVEELGGHGSPWMAVTQRLVEAVKQGDGRQVWVVGTAATAPVKNALIGGSALGLLGAMAPGRSLLALRPAADLVGAVASGHGGFAPAAGAPAGRAALVGGRRWTAVQVPRHPALVSSGAW